MAAPTYSTDLTTINVVDTAGGTTGWSAIGTGGAGLNSETDYFIQGDGCLSKNGWTAATKGMIYNATTTTITAGDAIYIWLKQNNRNLLDTKANGGGQVIVGSSSSAYDHFYVDGSNVDGSDLAGWFTYAVDPTQTPSTTTGSPTNTNFIGALWKILGSGTLKGAPNGIDVFRHGRELRAVDGDLGNGFATFDGMALHDAATTRRYGILTPVIGGYIMHGAVVMGQSGTSVDFRDSDRVISVLNDDFVPSTFNEFQIINSSSNVEWTNVQIVALGTTAPFVLTLNVGTFTGDLCRFVGAGQTTFQSTGTCTNTTWQDSGNVAANECDLSGSSFITSTVAADGAAVTWNETISSTHTISELDNTTFEMGTNNHHAISFSTGVSNGADITLTGIEFTGFDADGTGDSDNSILEFLATTGTITVNLIGCTVDGAGASSSNFTVDTRAGATVNVNFDPKTFLVNVKNEDMTNIQNARVFVETSEDQPTGEIYQAAVTTLSQAAGTATCTTTAAHRLETGDKVVIRGAQPDGYNKVATVTVSSTTVFTYSVDSGLSSPATGTPVVSYVALQGLTDASGNISISRTWGTDQTFMGWARKSNVTAPFYSEASISTTISSTINTTVNATLGDDE